MRVARGQIGTDLASRPVRVSYRPHADEPGADPSVEMNVWYLDLLQQ